jgi:hypothetical protein
MIDFVISIDIGQYYLPKVFWIIILVKVYDLPMILTTVNFVIRIRKTDMFASGALNQIFGHPESVNRLAEKKINSVWKTEIDLGTIKHSIQRLVCLKLLIFKLNTWSVDHNVLFFLF